MTDVDQRARLRLAAQNGAVRALVHAESSDEAIRELMREVCENLGWTLGEFWAPDPAADVLRLEAVWSDPLADVAAFVQAGRQMTFARGVGLPGRVWETLEPRWIDDVLEDENFPRVEAARSGGLRGAFAVPVPIDDDQHGVLEFLTRQALAPDEELLETMAAVGGYLGQFVQQRRAESALRASEEQFRTFSSTIPDAAFLIDEDGTIIYVNEAARRIFGYAPSELMQTRLTRLMPERLREEHEDWMRTALEADEPRVAGEGVEITGLHRDGTEIPLEITYGTFEKDGHRYVTGVARDITERHRTEERLKFQARMLDAVGEAVIATDLDGKILYWNAFAERLFGWSSEEVLGRDIADVTPTVGSREKARHVMARLSRGEPWSGEFMVKDRSGREFPVLLNDSPIMDEDGRLLGIIGTSIDITERKRREEGQRFLAEAGRVLASSLDYETTLRSVATLAIPHFGDWCLVHIRSGDEGITPVARVVPEEDARAADLLERLLSEGSDLTETVLASDSAVVAPSSTGPPVLREELLRQAGVRSVLAVPIRARGTTLGVMTFALVRSGRRHDQLDAGFAEELGRRAGLAIDNARLYRDAEEGNRAKADFLAVVSHELRTPLNAIAGYADLLAGGITGRLNEGQQRHVERIKVGAGHLAHLIDEVLSFARVESGRESVRLETVDLARVATEAAVVLEPDAIEKGLTLDVDVPEQGLELSTDPGKVRQVLVNLLSNAVKYTEEGSVRLTVRPTAGGAEIQVSDTGIGIPADARQRIFEPFWQAESPNTRTMGGTGLGLSVSRRLIGLLDGDISVESEPGAGSTFTVRIPDRQ